MMTFNDYQVRAHETAGPYMKACEELVEGVGSIFKADMPGDSALDMFEEECQRIRSQLKRDYVTMGLAGEAGEFANKMKKVLRDNDGDLDPDQRKALVGELGGVLWYLSECCTQLGVHFEDVAKANVAQLKARKVAGTLHGSGDDR